MTGIAAPTLTRLAGDLAPGAARALEAIAPIDALVAEGCLRVPSAPAEVVVGFRSEHRARLLAAAAHVAPAHHARIERWLAAHPNASDLGFKVGRADDLQIYVRGDFEPDAVIAGYSGAEVPCSPMVVRHGLLLFEQPHALMLGLELAGARASGAVYTGLRRTRAIGPAISVAFRFLTAALVPAQPALSDAWQAIAPVLLDAAGEELVYISFAPAGPAPIGPIGPIGPTGPIGPIAQTPDGADDSWVKLDVGARPLGVARRLLEAAGLGDAWPGVLAQIERHAIQRWSHLGVRLGSRGMAVVFYWSLPTADPV
jgi:hypothetical protein